MLFIPLVTNLIEIASIVASYCDDVSINEYIHARIQQFQDSHCPTSDTAEMVSPFSTNPWHSTMIFD